MAEDIFADRYEKPIVTLEDTIKEVSLDFYKSGMTICIVKEGLFGKKKYYNGRKFYYSELDTFLYKIEKKFLGPVIHVRIDFGLELLDWDQVVQFKFSIPYDKIEEYTEFFNNVEKEVNG